jgi:hypothetical protein
VARQLAIKDLFTHRPPETIDFGFGDLEHKARESNATYVADSLHIVTTPLWALYLRLQRGLNEVEELAREALTRGGIDKVVRHWLKRKRELTHRK